MFGLCISSSGKPGGFSIPTEEILLENPLLRPQTSPFLISWKPKPQRRLPTLARPFSFFDPFSSSSKDSGSSNSRPGSKDSGLSSSILSEDHSKLTSSSQMWSEASTGGAQQSLYDENGDPIVKPPKNERKVKVVCLQIMMS